MTRQLALAVAVALAAASPAMSETSPNDVQFDGGAVAQSLTGVPGDPTAGVKVMTTRALGNCVACHLVSALPDVPFPGDIGPALDGAASRYSEAQLRGIITNSKHTFEGSFMPAFYKTEGYIRPGDAYTGKGAAEPLPPILSAQQIEDVLAYVMTLTDE
ncbi:monoheme cytochrome SoxX (sulfur oxidation) [Rhodobacter aestuarii]|uniref:Monoheme cytochrome SoxX (Sulfur oxidation) n=1 Tax=Rhodobacter aestuarii TaxID=453582 RepID=A0A1N7IXQ2_9RHOB|nr:MULTISPECIES: sulfur oxidation c-type cytochrome SoxX [Rhodobacter]PTV97419.1 monoheme cytochrome SoxX (sulfur oxidation) [Rhodobacter aestuarii]SIS41873.1 monoheme cytochrome SoxX (sulfur oxidation) [Rhodobacter aestuarii]SOC00425.1 monoheme cytochrome SoxX (sulfur oxidation) [Rhodobacter sp. JA431]